jgi:hypothetical protein
MSVPLTLAILMLLHGKLQSLTPKELVMMVMLAQLILVAQFKVVFSTLMSFVLLLMLVTLLHVSLRQDVFSLISLNHV